MEIEKKEAALIQELLTFLEKGELQRARRFIKGKDMLGFTGRLESKRKEFLRKIPHGDNKLKIANVLVDKLIRFLSPLGGEVPKLLLSKKPDVETIKRKLEESRRAILGLEVIEREFGISY